MKTLAELISSTANKTYKLNAQILYIFTITMRKFLIYSKQTEHIKQNVSSTKDALTKFKMYLKLH